MQFFLNCTVLTGLTALDGGFNGNVDLFSKSLLSQSEYELSAGKDDVLPSLHIENDFPMSFCL